MPHTEDGEGHKATLDNYWIGKVIENGKIISDEVPNIRD